MFVNLARDSIKFLKQKGKISERMIQIFVHDFREGFNYNTSIILKIDDSENGCLMGFKF